MTLTLSLPRKYIYVLCFVTQRSTTCIYIRPQIKNYTESSVVCDALNKISPVVEKGLALFYKDCWPEQIAYRLFVCCIENFKMAARPCKRRMNVEEALDEIFADRDSDVSDFSDSEFEANVSEESEEEEEENEGILRQIIGLIQLGMRWNNSLLKGSVFNSVMPRNRYQTLLQFLHFADNSQFDPNDPVHDRFYKVRPLVDHLVSKFKFTYIPEKEISVDEELLLWKGRLVFKQYIPLKRATFGIKMFSLCENSGYLWNSYVYLLPFTKALSSTMLQNLPRWVRLNIDNELYSFHVPYYS